MFFERYNASPARLQVISGFGCVSTLQLSTAVVVSTASMIRSPVSWNFGGAEQLLVKEVEHNTNDFGFVVRGEDAGVVGGHAGVAPFIRFLNTPFPLLEESVP